MLSSFESIDVSIFPKPTENLRDLDLNTTTEDFHARIELLKNKTLQLISQPRRFGNTFVNSQNVERLVRNFAQNLDNGTFHVKSAVRRYQREEIDRETRNFEKNFAIAYNKIHLPVTDGLAEQLMQTKHALLDSFKERTASIDLETGYRDEEFERLKSAADEKIDFKKRENRLIMEKNQLHEKGVVRNNTYIIAFTPLHSPVHDKIKSGEQWQWVAVSVLACVYLIRYARIKIVYDKWHRVDRPSLNCYHNTRLLKKCAIFAQSFFLAPLSLRS